MFPVIDKLPDNVSMCDYYKDKVSSRHEGKKKFKYIQALHDGRAFYIPITTSVWKAFGLKDKISETDGEDGSGYDVNYIVGEALSDIVGSIQQQVRDDVLDGIEQSVIQHVNENMAKIMHKPLREEIERQADEKAPRMLEEPK